MNNKTKIYKIYSLIIKTVVIILAFWFIYHRLFVKDNLAYVISFEKYFNNRYVAGIIILTLLLMFFNWGLESLKWQFLIRKIEKLSFIKAFIAVLSGMVVSVFTPNRIGEYAGRVFVLEKADRWEGVLITILGSMSQLLITILAGAVSFVFFANEYIDLSEYHEYYFYGLIFIIAILIIVLFLLFFNISFLTGIINKLPGKLSKFKNYGKIYSFYSVKELLYLLLLSLGRYMIFTTQFILLFMLFGIKMPYEQAFFMIAMIYLAMAAIPTIALTELGVRGSVALYFINMYFEKHNLPCNDVGILAASSALWFINLAIPALFGVIFIFKLKLFRKS